MGLGIVCKAVSRRYRINGKRLLQRGLYAGAATKIVDSLKLIFGQKA